jgi:hypothetical protein
LRRCAISGSVFWMSSPYASAAPGPVTDRLPIALALGLSGLLLLRLARR